VFDGFLIMAAMMSVEAGASTLKQHYFFNFIGFYIFLKSETHTPLPFPGIICVCIYFLCECPKFLNYA